MAEEESEPFKVQRFVQPIHDHRHDASSDPDFGSALRSDDVPPSPADRVGNEPMGRPGHAQSWSAELGEMYSRTEVILRGSVERSRFAYLFRGINFPPSKTTAEAVIDECIELQTRIASSGITASEFFNIKRALAHLETRYARLQYRRTVYPAVMVIYGGWALLFFGLRSFDLGDIAQQVLGVEVPVRLMTLGVVGAFMYLATSVLRRQRESEPDPQLAGIIEFAARLAMAVVVPIVLVTIFFHADGSLKQIGVTPELLSFICGYSAKLVVDLFNKIVEKGSQMIQAI